MKAQLQEIMQDREDVHHSRAGSVIQLVEERRGRLLRVAQRITGDREEAEDIVQDSVIKVLANLDRFRGDSQVYTWIHSIVANTAISRVRRRDWYLKESLDSKLEAGELVLQNSDHGSYLNPEQEYARSELQAMLVAELRELKPSYRDAIFLCDLQERSYLEAAEMLKLPVTTVKACLHRGRKILRRRLQQRLSDTLSTSYHSGLPLAG